MTEIRPFHGIRYNEKLIPNISSVICPPYDIITSELALELNQRSNHNFVRIEHGQDLPSDNDKDNKYTRSAEEFEQWLSEEILKSEKLPAIYLHHHLFRYQGKEYLRRGIIAAVKLEDWDKMIIRPHESTRGKPKDDRLKILWSLNANTSPVFAVYENQGGQIFSILSQKEKDTPVIELESDGEKHRVWAITDTKAISQISGHLSGQPLYIADGHHRYESALNYKKERLTCCPSSSGEEGFNFVMMELVDLTDRGLIILSPHRLVRGISRSILNQLNNRLAAVFQTEEIPLDTGDIPGQVNNLLNEDDNNEVRIVLFGPSTDKLIVLTLKELDTASQMLPYFHSSLYKRLDVSIVDHIILEEMLGLTSEQEETSLDFNHDIAVTIDEVLKHEYQLALFLRPTRTEVIKAIADTGDRMPRKSTYFYPKPPSGLILRRLE